MNFKNKTLLIALVIIEYAIGYGSWAISFWHAFEGKYDKATFFLVMALFILREAREDREELEEQSEEN